MKPFLIGSQLPPDPVETPAIRGVTHQGQVLDAIRAGWVTRKQIEQATGLTCNQVNLCLQHGIRRGDVQREYPLSRGCTKAKAVTQRYRMAERRSA